jgi:thiamine-phosphate pyrophosphorylase
MSAQNRLRYFAPLPRLMVLTDMEIQTRWSHENLARAAFAGGADAVQLRDKRADHSTRLATARRLVSLAAGFGPGRHLFVNDDPELALEAEAAGVHVGPDDPSPEEARRIVGENRWVGFSAGTAAEARWAEEAGADYLGVGAVFGSQTKRDAGDPIGLDGLRKVVESTRLPVIAIGSITAGDVPGILACGAHGVAVISAVCLADDPERATAELARELERGLAAGGLEWARG